MMQRSFLRLLLSLALCVSGCQAVAITLQPPAPPTLIPVGPGIPLTDEDLGNISGADDVNLMGSLYLNTDTNGNKTVDNSLSVGFNVGGTSTYLVFSNLHGIVNFSPITLDVLNNPGGSDYVSIGLPQTLKFTNFEFESLSVQSDPLATPTNNLGHFSINGTLNMTGTLRMWAH